MNKKPYIIAEIASAHEGDPKLLLRLGKEAIKSNADAIKFQIFNRDNLIAKDNALYDEFGEIEINQEEWLKTINFFSNQSIDVIVEPYDVESIKIIEKSNLKVHFKAPASNINDKKYLIKLCEQQTRIYLAVGGATIEEIQSSIKFIDSLNFKNEIILLCGFQNFPTKIEDSNLGQLGFLGKKFNLKLAYADHINSDDIYMRKQIPIMAYAAGASYLEKHITLDRSKKGRDYYSSLNPDEFKEFVLDLKRLSEVFGDPKNMGKSKAEIDYRKFSKRNAVAKKFIKKGTICNADLFNFKRTSDIGINEKNLIDYIGKKIKIDLEKEKQLRKEHFI